jgi:hypothetical protein
MEIPLVKLTYYHILIYLKFDTVVPEARIFRFTSAKILTDNQHYWHPKIETWH